MSIDLDILAMDLIERLYKAYQNKAETFARRGKDLPQLVAQTGLVTALIFYLSKSDKENYEKIYNYLIQQNTDVETVYKSLRDEAEGEGKGYTVLLALINVALNKMSQKGFITVNECKDLSVFKNIIII